MHRYEKNKLQNLTPSKPAKKSLGQNFLIDENVLAKIIESANLHENEEVLEIGPGPGALTIALLKNNVKVTCVELDSNMIQTLQSNLEKECTSEQLQNVRIINGDALKIDIRQLKLKSGYKLIANIPYYITSPLIRKFLKEEITSQGVKAILPEKIVFMIQKEVAQRIVEKSKSSVLSINVKLYGDPTIVSIVKKECFSPQPKVDSAILEINVKKRNEIPDIDIKEFSKLIEACFLSPRKKIHHNFRNLIHSDSEESKRVLLEAKINPDDRAENLSISDYLNLYNILKNKTQKN